MPGAQGWGGDGEEGGAFSQKEAKAGPKSFQIAWKTIQISEKSAAPVHSFSTRFRGVWGEPDPLSHSVEDIPE